MAGLEIRLAHPDEYARVGEITVDAYRFDGLLEADEHYEVQLADAELRALEAELVVAVDPAPTATSDAPSAASPAVPLSARSEILGTVTYCPLGSPWRELGGDTAGEFRMLAVASSARGRGVGRRLVEYCMDRTTELGLVGVVICSLPAMTTAHRLYASMGFLRHPELDFEPVPGVLLWGFRYDPSPP